MSFLLWHYGEGIRYYLTRYKFSLVWINHYFSLPLLVTSLFSPWRRLVITERERGFNPSKWFSRVSYNLVSRFMGATVRIILLVAGVISLILAVFFGIVGLLVWLLLPFLSYSLYKRIEDNPESQAKKILTNSKTESGYNISSLFTNNAGKFVLEHLGISIEEIANIPDKNLEFGDVHGFSGIIQTLTKANIFADDFYNSRGLVPDDLVNASLWWDTRVERLTKVESSPKLGRPGIGLSLLYGYTPTLDKYSTDLSLTNFSHHLVGRGQSVSRIERAVSSDRSVIVTGQPGVGKKTVVLEFADKAATGKFGEKQTYWRVVELNHNFLFSQSTDLNKKKVELSQILLEAKEAGNIILVLRELHRYTNPEVEGYDFTDVFEHALEKKGFQIIAIASNVEYERFLALNMKLRKYFERIEVLQPTREEAMKILIEFADKLEDKGILVQTQALREILEGADKYITDTPFPEKALEMLDGVTAYMATKGEKVMNVDSVREVLSEKTGVSMARLTEVEKGQLTNLEQIIHESLVDQEEAVRLIAQILRSKQTGVVDAKRPIGSFLFLGPTGVGKTETAKALSRVYFGDEESIVRFDMAEYAGSEGIERLIGSSARNQPGTLTTAIRNKPASLLLLDELEKATSEVRNIFLRLLDEGVITDASGRSINCQHLFVIATSNAGAEFIREAVEKGEDGEALQNNVVNHVMEQGLFSPEFINRFDGVVVYGPLGQKELTLVAKLMLTKLSSSLKKQNIELTFDESAAEKLASEGYEPAFGARPMRRIIDIVLGDTIGKALLAGSIQSGDRVVLKAGQKNSEYLLQKLA